MSITRAIGLYWILPLLLSAQGLAAPASDLADAAMNRNRDAVRALLQKKVDVNAPQLDGTTALHWAVRADDLEVADLLIRAGANVAAANREGVMPMQLAALNGSAAMIEKLIKAGAIPNAPLSKFGDTTLMLAARTGKTDAIKVLADNGAQVNAVETWGGTTALMWAVSERHLDAVQLLIDNHADVNHADAQRFTPLFWAVDRRNMELGTNGFPWTVTTDPLPLIKKLLDAGANPNAIVNNTPRGRNRNASPRFVFATALHRAAFAGDLELARLLLAYGADPHAISSDRESMLEAATGLALIPGYQVSHPEAERLELCKLLVELGEDVNWADTYGITPLMAAANLGYTKIVQYLVDAGADLGAYDLGKRLDGAFMASVEPLMPVDYAIGVGTFLPNNSVENHAETSELMFRLMKERGIKHTTSECTLRGFSCSIANVDPKTATPAEIVKIRRLATGNQLTGITGGLSVQEKDQDKNKK